MSEVTPEELHAAAAVWRKANVEAWRYFIKAFSKAEEALR